MKVTKSSVNEGIIEHQILEKLGKIPDYKEIKINHAFDTHYRVNIYGNSEGSGKVILSYFITCDDNGKILNSNPEIKSYV